MSLFYFLVSWNSVKGVYFVSFWCFEAYYCSVIHDSSVMGYFSKPLVYTTVKVFF